MTSASSLSSTSLLVASEYERPTTLPSATAVFTISTSSSLPSLSWIVSVRAAERNAAGATAMLARRFEGDEAPAAATSIANAR